jgi:hypothetical protein
MKFDDRDRQALRALGFTLSDDGEVAELEEGSMRIDIIRPVNSDRLWVTIILPAGSLRLLMPCADLAEAAGIEEDEVA